MPIRYTRARSGEATQIVGAIFYGRQWSVSYPGRMWRPPTDVYETRDALVVRMEIAGMSEDDFDITFADGRLTVRGVRHDREEKLGYHQMEIPYGEFGAEIHLAIPIRAEAITASYQNGFLIITLPKDDRRY